MIFGDGWAVRGADPLRQKRAHAQRPAVLYLVPPFGFRDRACEVTVRLQIVGEGQPDHGGLTLNHLLSELPAHQASWMRSLRLIGDFSFFTGGMPARPKPPQLLLVGAGDMVDRCSGT